MIGLTISSAALIIVVLALRHLLKGRISLRLQYAIWALVLLRLLVPFNPLQSPISVLNAIENHTQAVTASDPGTQAPIPEEPTHAFPVIDTAPLYMDAGSETPKTHLDWEILLSLVWYTGIAAVGLCLLLSNLSFMRKLRKVRKEYPADNYRLKVYVVDTLPTPFLYGLFSPAVYITPDIADDETRRTHVLEHELCHYRHGDQIWSVLRSLCLAVYWFNPFVWLAAAASRRDAELACDEATIRRLGEEHRMDYGRTLIGLTCQKRGALDLLSCATAMIESKKGIQERIALIVKKPKTAALTLVAVLLILAVTAGCTFTGAKPGDAAAPYAATAAVTPSATAPSAVTPSAAASSPAVTVSAGSTASPPKNQALAPHVYDGKKPLSQEELQKATDLSIINVKSLDFLRDAPNLKYVTAGNGTFYNGAGTVSGDIGALGGLTNLQYVNFSYANVTGDIGSLKGLKNLQELYLIRTKVSGDLAAMNDLAHLNRIAVDSNSITGRLSTLSGMPALEELTLSGTGITGDLGELVGLKKLKVISLYGTPNVTGDINALKTLRYLFSIEFVDTNIPIQLSALNGFSALQSIYFDSGNISGRLSDLSGASDLMFVYLGGNKIAGDLSDLMKLPKLQYIALLSAPSITGNLSTLKGNANLWSITLEDTKITGDLSDLKGCTNLNSISLRDPGFTGDLSVLSDLSHLTSVTLLSTSVTGDLSALSGLRELNSIALTSPDITGDLSTLSRHNNLRNLRLSCPGVKGDISALGVLTLLSTVNLSGTNVSGDIGALNKLSYLNLLDLSATGVTGDAGTLSGLSMLDETDFTNTKITGSLHS